MTNKKRPLNPRNYRSTNGVSEYTLRAIQDMERVAGDIPPSPQYTELKRTVDTYIGDAGKDPQRLTQLILTMMMMLDVDSETFNEVARRLNVIRGQTQGGNQNG